jgi:hypothetical protein
MKSIMYSSLALVLCATPGTAQTVGGLYHVQGSNFDGSPYSGTANIVISGDGSCRIIWITGSTSSEGVCMQNGASVAAGYLLQKQVGVVIYDVKPNGSLDGVWTLAGRSGRGTELLTPRH